jgi:hypothetical protein
MRINKKGVITLFITFLLLVAPAVAENTFPNALTEADLPSGFELVVSEGDEFNSTQSWKTPSDSLGASSVSVVKYNKSTDIDTAWAGFELLGAETISFEGAEKALNYTFFVNIYVALKSNHVVTVTGFSDFDDLKTLMEVQLGKLSSGAAPGFSLLVGLISISLIAITMKKKRN